MGHHYERDTLKSPRFGQEFLSTRVLGMSLESVDHRSHISTHIQWEEAFRKSLDRWFPIGPTLGFKVRYYTILLWANEVHFYITLFLSITTLDGIFCEFFLDFTFQLMFYLFCFFCLFCLFDFLISILLYCLKILESWMLLVLLYSPYASILHDFPHTTSKPFFAAKHRLWANPNIKTGFQTP